MPRTPPSISVILSTFNQPDWLEKVLWGYGVQEFKDFEIVIADDGSGPSTFGCIEKMRSKLDVAIHHVWHADNGFQKCEILNHAIRCAGGAYLVFSDGDCIPRRDFLNIHYANRARGRFLSGGAVRLPLEISQAITADDIIAGSPFSMSWLRRNARTSSQPLPRLSRLLRASCSGSLARVLNQITPTRATWNGNNASAWKSDICAVNGMDERMAYGGEDCELGERLIHAGLAPKQIRFSAALLHLEHARGYVHEEALRLNREIRRTTRATRAAWTQYGLSGNQASKSPRFLFNGQHRHKDEVSSEGRVPRLFICDSEIKRAGGHNVELASVIADAALRSGLQPVIATHHKFNGVDEFGEACIIRPVFRFAFMRKWSLGIDGKSVHQRDAQGRIVSRQGLRTAFSRLRERFSSTSPTTAIDIWSHDFARWLREFQPTHRDRVLLSTACDFTLLGLPPALKKAAIKEPLRIDLLFHLSLWDGREGEPNHREHALLAFRHQVESSLAELKGHQIRLFATTEELARQLNQALGKELWSKIDYPIRRHSDPQVQPLAAQTARPGGVADCQVLGNRSRLLIAGAIRREKGRYELSKMISAIWDQQLASGQWQLAFQCPDKRWKRLLPPPLGARAEEFKTYRDRELYLNTATLDADAYQDWIRSASVGLFTYDARRYYARCSGVLLEMMIAGIPVIVPAGSWLSHQLRPAVDCHLDRLWDDLEGTETERPQSLLPMKHRHTMQWELERPASAVMLAFEESPAIGDSIQLTVNFRGTAAGSHQVAAKYSLEHRPHGEPRVLISLPPGATSICVQYQYRIRSEASIAAPRVRVVNAAVAPPESSAGLIAADLDQIPRLLNEFTAHRQHYQQTASAGAASWAEKHSPDRFMHTLLNQHAASWLDAA